MSHTLSCSTTGSHVVHDSPFNTLCEISKNVLLEATADKFCFTPDIFWVSFHFSRLMSLTEPKNTVNKKRIMKKQCFQLFFFFIDSRHASIHVYKRNILKSFNCDIMFQD